MEPEKVRLFTFDPAKAANWKFKVKQSKRRMKLYIKMNKDETTQWDSLCGAAKPPEMSKDDFARIIFYKGVESFMGALTERINSLSDEEKAEIMEKSGLESPETEDKPTDEAAKTDDTESEAEQEGN